MGDVTAEQLHAYLKDMGIDHKSDDFRHCVHEAVHALQEELEGPWSNRRVSQAVGTADDISTLGGEMVCRAAEGLVMQRLGMEWDLESWAMISAMEWLRTGRGEVPFKFWVRGIQEAQTSSLAAEYVDQLFHYAKENGYDDRK